MKEIPRPLKLLLDVLTWAGCVYLLWNALSEPDRQAREANTQKVQAADRY
jgi:threonine/homoserine/homoserine lactone efflux protein